MANHHHDKGEVSLPVLQEELQFSKRVCDTGKGIRLHKTVSEEVWRVDDSVQQQTLDIQHVPMNTWISGTAPTNRYEGDTLIVPVLEEVLVVEKRLRLKEEIRITVQSHQHAMSERVALRKEQVSAERFDETTTEPEDRAAEHPFMTPPEPH